MQINFVIFQHVDLYISFGAYENGVSVTNVGKDIDTNLILEEF